MAHHQTASAFNRGKRTSIISDTMQLVRGRETELLAALGISPPRRGHMRCPTLSHEDRNPSWRFDHTKGRWFCSCGSGDILDLVIAIGRAHNALSAVTWMREGLGLPPLGDRQETPADRAAWQQQAEERRQCGSPEGA